MKFRKILKNFGNLLKCSHLELSTSVQDKQWQHFEKVNCTGGNFCSMKLAYVYPESLPDQKARAVQVIHTCHALAEEVDQVWLCLAENSVNPGEILRYYGLPELTTLKLVAIKRRFGPLVSSSLFNWQLRRKLAIFKPDAIITRHVQIVSGVEKMKIPTVFEMHQFFQDKPGTKRKVLKLESKVLQSASALAFLSGNLEKRICEFRDISIPHTVIPSGTTIYEEIIDKRANCPMREIVYSGSTRYGWKGMHVLFKAIDKIASVRLHLFGTLEGHWHKEHPLIKSLQSRGLLELHGYLPSQELRQAICRFQIAVLPNSADDINSRLYTSPLKLLDYMAAKMAIVASDLPSIRELVTTDDVLLVEPDNPESLAQGICTLLENPQLRLRLAENAWQKVRLYSWKNRANKFLHLVQATLPTAEVLAKGKE